MFVKTINRISNARYVSLHSMPVAACPSPLTFRFLVFVVGALFGAFLLASSAIASEVGDFLGRRVTRVDVVIEGAPNANVSEMRALIDVAAGQDYSRFAFTI